MKKLLFTIVLSVAVVTASFHAQVKYLIHPEKKINKNISVTISSDDTYNHHVYAYCNARIDYTVMKTNGKNTDTLMQKTYPAIQLKELASFSKTFAENIQVPNVSDRKEQVVISYTITYISKNSELKIQHEKFVQKGTTDDQLCISI